jgi:hypothetical protein
MVTVPWWVLITLPLLGLWLGACIGYVALSLMSINSRRPPWR